MPAKIVIHIDEGKELLDIRTEGIYIETPTELEIKIFNKLTPKVKEAVRSCLGNSKCISTTIEFDKPRKCRW